jgi:hypothetical protein
METYMQLEERPFIRHLKAERGDIINFFSKLEFLVNELIQARILGLFSEKAYDFDLLLEHIDFSGRIALMKKWGIINNKEKNKITEIASVRNQLAHRWNEREVLYGKDSDGNGITIIKNIKKFREDAEQVWMNLINKYKEEEKQIGLVIAKLEDFNTINLWAEMHKDQETVDDSERFFPSI